MKLECQKERLKNFINLAEKITGKGLSLPVLGLVVLETEDKNLKIKATNLEVGMEISLPAQIEKSGQVAISGAVLNNVLSNLTKTDKLTLELIGNNLLVVTPKQSILIKTFPLEDFPTIPKVTKGLKINLTATDLLTGLKSVWYAAAVSDIKPEIASVYLHATKDKLVFVATDSFRLAEKKIKLGETITEPTQLIIPSKNIAEIIRVFETVTGPIQLQADKNQISLTASGLCFTSRLIDGVFPDYQQIIPTTSQTEAVVLKDELQQALRLANVFSDRFNQVDLKIITKEKLFEIGSRNSDIGETTSQLAAALTGDDLENSFNAKYLLEPFSVIASDDVYLRFNGPSRPLVFGGVTDNSFTYLVMPVNR